MVRFLLLLLLAGFLAGCEIAGPDAEDDPGAARPLTAHETRLVASGNAFGFRLFDAVGRDVPGDNVFVSPLSVSAALGMTLNGARGQTRADMEATLALAGLAPEAINHSYQTLFALLEHADPAVALDVAQSIWYRDGFEVLPSFLDVNRRYFDAEVRGLDFADPKAPDVINGWIDGRTRGLIPRVIETIDPLVMLYLINAVYFKGTWQIAFDAALTRDDRFHAPGGDVPVKMMVTQGPFAYHSNGRVDVVDLPYGNGRYVMTLVVPSGGAPLDSVTAGLDEAAWNDLVAAMRPLPEVQVQMPRFRLEARYSLNDALTRLGMGVAFDPSRADFGAISEREDLFISSVIHSTFVEVDEKGTEAAAVTVVEMQTTSAGGDPQPPVVRADRPFLFVLRERESGTLLFMGRVVRPETG